MFRDQEDIQNATSVFETLYGAEYSSVCQLESIYKYPYFGDSGYGKLQSTITTEYIITDRRRSLLS